MKAALMRMFAGIVSAIVLALPTPGHAQVPALFAPPQLDQMLAPIALYPDLLLGQILMASTYPLEVVEANRWLQLPGNAGLRDDQLATALQSENWDPSVKSLLPFPQILQMMNSHRGWMQQLGDAFLAQEAAVMDAVQRLRARANAAGTLYSTPEAYVSSDGTVTTIEPADPQIIYVPAYDPNAIYGEWPYPDYPPYYFPFGPAYGLYAGSGIGFGFGITIVFPLWGWNHWDWHQHRMHIDHDRFDAIDRDAGARERHRREPAETWQHDPFHRRGIAYRDAASQQKFLGAHASGQAQARRPYRGFESAPAIAAPPQPTARPAPVPANPPRPSPGFGDIERGRDAHHDAERGRASRGPSSPPAVRQPAAEPRRVEPRHGSRSDAGDRRSGRDR
jgi:hypothetical protein